MKLLQEMNAAKKEEEKLKELEAELRAEEEKKEEIGAAVEEVKTKEELPKLSQLIITESQTIVSAFLKNEAFLKQVNEANGDELSIMNKFKALGKEILDEACSAIFDCSKTQLLMEKLAEYLTAS